LALHAHIYGVLVTHKRKLRRNVPIRNAEELFERLGYVENFVKESRERESDLQRQVSNIRASIVEIQQNAVMKEDLIASERRLARLIENRGLQGD